MRGGPSVLVRTLASALSRAGVETHVATTDDDGSKRLDVPYGVPVAQDGVTYRFFRRQTRPYIFCWPLADWLARHISEFDLAHIHTLFSFATLPAAYWARRHGVPYIVRPLGTLNEWGMKNRRPGLKKLSFAALESRVLKHAALVHYTSEQERIEAARLGFAHRPIVIPNPVSLPPWSREELTGEFRLRHPELKNAKIVLFLSRLDKKKGLDLLLPAFEAMRAQHRDARLVIAGSGEPEFIQSIQRSADRINRTDVVWTGFLTGREKWAALADSDVFVLPSYSENFGIAVAEALLIGAPVVVSDQVAIHREISQAGAGLVVPCSIPALSEAMNQILSSPGFSSRLARNGTALARERFSSDAVMARLMEAYETICEPHSVQPQQHSVSVPR